MTDRMSAKDYANLLKQKDGRTGGRRRRTSGEGMERMTVGELRERQGKGQKEADVEALCTEYLEAHGWWTTHHDPFQQAGPPLLLSARQADLLQAEGVRVMRYGGHVPTYLPIRQVREQDRAWPDRVCVHPSACRMVLIEFKRPGEKPRADQQAFLAACSDMAFWCDSLETLIRELAARGLPGGA